MDNSNLSLEERCLSALFSCLQTERDCLVLLKTEALLDNNAEKDRLSQELVRIRAGRREAISDSEAMIQRPELKNLYQRLFDYCAGNLRLIDRSLSRQSILIENLRRLMSGPANYSQKGASLPSAYNGRVIEGFY